LIYISAVKSKFRRQAAAPNSWRLSTAAGPVRRLEAAATTSTLALLMARIALANHVNNAAAANDLALPTDAFDAGANFHRWSLIHVVARLAESESI
jgi:hypothetical protein